MSTATTFSTGSADGHLAGEAIHDIHRAMNMEQLSRMNFGSTSWERPACNTPPLDGHDYQLYVVEATPAGKVLKPATTKEFRAHLAKERRARQWYHIPDNRYKSGYMPIKRVGKRTYIDRKTGRKKVRKANIALDQVAVNLHPVADRFLKEMVRAFHNPVQFVIDEMFKVASEVIWPHYEYRSGREMIALAVHPRDGLLHFHPIGSRVIHGGVQLSKRGDCILKPSGPERLGKGGQAMRGQGVLADAAPAVDRNVELGVYSSQSDKAKRLEKAVGVFEWRHPGAVPTDLALSRAVDGYFWRRWGSDTRVQPFVEEYIRSHADQRRGAIIAQMSALQQELEELEEAAVVQVMEPEPEPPVETSTKKGKKGSDERPDLAGELEPPATVPKCPEGGPEVAQTPPQIPTQPTPEKPAPEDDLGEDVDWQPLGGGDETPGQRITMG